MHRSLSSAFSRRLCYATLFPFHSTTPCWSTGRKVKFSKALEADNASSSLTSVSRRTLTSTVRSATPLTPTKHLRNPIQSSAVAATIPKSSNQAQQNAKFTVSSDHANATAPDVHLTENAVAVTWASGIESKFHNIWLRDHCRCPKCYHPKTKQRLMNTLEIPHDIKPIEVEGTTEGLQVIWPSPSTSSISSIEQQSPSNLPSNPTPSDKQAEAHHASLYPWAWLRTNSYAPKLADAPTISEASQRILWGKGIESAPPTVSYDEVMQSDLGVFKWLSKIAQFGFSFVSGVPVTPTDTEALIRRIAFIRETHYGGFWDFTSNLEHGDTAYTNLALGAHTDTTYFTDPAGLQLFHLLSHTSGSQGSTPARGGESLLVDGFLAAKILSEVHPDAYHTLSTVRIQTHSAGDENILVRPLFHSGYPILEHDPVTGELVLVRYNNDDRSVLRLAEHEVEPFYDALRKWQTIIENKEGEYWSQLTPGNALIFDNHRVLHGRGAFVGSRRLCGAYVPHDDYRSRLDTLKARYGDPSHPTTSLAARGVWDDGL